MITEATWVGPPKSYSRGRNRPIQLGVVHATAGSEGTRSAEAGAAYDKTRTDGTSTNEFVDQDTALLEVRDEDRAHAARYHGNEIGYHFELCGSANQTDSQWHDAASWPTLRIAAGRMAALFIRRGWGLADVRRLSVAEVRAAYYAPAAQRPRGICGHVDVTKAFPEDEGDHYDPGPGFPWSEFLQMVRLELGGAGIEVSMHRHVYQGFPDEADYSPAVAGGPSRVHITDGTWYRVQQYGRSIDELQTQAGAGPITLVTPANCGLKTYVLARLQFSGYPATAALEVAGGGGSAPAGALNVQLTGTVDLTAETVTMTGTATPQA